MCEILAPVGTKENLISAINGGADAVYLGLLDFSARKMADNFSQEDLKFAVSYAKTFGVKVYVTVNTLIKDSEINALIDNVNFAYSIGVDAFILQDIFLGKYLKDIMPDITLHLSTQAGVCNVYGAIQAKNMGFSRVILARETKIKDIEEISKIIETEVFIQGALCTCFSGHCYFSSFVGGNSGNRGFCKQPCRKEYSYISGGKTLNKGYVLSLADLSVEKDIFKLKELGVKSFKIEGRMRSREYVYFASKFYKELLNGNFDNDLYNNLKIAFNRGDYTKGLAFGQDKRFISSKIQNNKGLFIGKVKKVTKDLLFLDKNAKFYNGDCFKIIRNGIEVSSAIAVMKGGSLVIKHNQNVEINDEVCVTKRLDSYNKYVTENLKKNIEVEVYIKTFNKIKLKCGNVLVESDDFIEESISKPITKDEVIKNLNKVDVYPYKVSVKFIEFSNNAFVLKSTLNNLRAKLYYELFYRNNFKMPYNIAKYTNNSICENVGKNNESAIIVSNNINLYKDYNHIIYAPYNYNELEDFSVSNSKIWLYIPPFFTSDDINLISNKTNNYYGVYVDSVWGIEYAKDNNLKCFAGVGVNVFNSIDVNTLKNLNVECISVSKELSFNEINSLNCNDLFVLTSGNIEIMDLIYCPFGKNCKNCTIINEFTLKDAENREFMLKRYKTTECRFKVYNMAKLDFDKNYNKIYDLSVKLPEKTTNGNYLKGVK